MRLRKKLQGFVCCLAIVSVAVFMCQGISWAESMTKMKIDRGTTPLRIRDVLNNAGQQGGNRETMKTIKPESPALADLIVGNEGSMAQEPGELIMKTPKTAPSNVKTAIAPAPKTAPSNVKTVAAPKVAPPSNVKTAIAPRPKTAPGSSSLTTKTPKTQPINKLRALFK